ncbi:Beta-2-glycoprotein I [Ceraceosorus bombacis]|uniref:Beta-2-glycoprotein I n=1 Tax=Ceraceosorus bombacis TaxID=401625 RepID=A0A0P1B8N3_9BASI|nr:Beta-2-glycoprotein I [Ceraceosorus bombacis]
MGVALLHDILALSELATLKSVLSVAVLPVETLVSMLYWTVLAIDPDLLVPPRLTDDPNNPGQVIKESIRLPLSADLAMHAAPAVFLLADFLLVSPPFPKKVRPAFVSGIATVAYCVWCERCAAVNGHYPYPLLGLLSLWPRLGLYAGCSVTMVLVLGAVRTIHSALDRRYKRVWDDTVAETIAGKVGELSKKHK